jgi:hypothetical protein
VATSLRISRGFHRLALFLAAIPLLLGGILSVYFAWVSAVDAKLAYDQQASLVCAQEAFRKKFYADLSRDEFDRRIKAKIAPVEAGEITLTNPDLLELGCSDFPRTVSVLEIFRAEAPGEFSWLAAFWPPLGFGLAVSLGVALAVYGIVRAIGWVIGGFTAS